MSNWQYAQVVPTVRWRSAMTLPRDLSIEKVGDRYLLRSVPVPELQVLEGKPVLFQNFSPTRFTLPKAKGPLRIHISSDRLQGFSMHFWNSRGDQLELGYDATENQWYLDRTASGNTTFEPGFARRHTAPRLSNRKAFDLELVIDHASVELFADSGLTVMTAIFFPDEPYSDIRIRAAEGFHINTLRYTPLRSMYAAAGMQN
jgi:fructan beta-fructosidase